MAQARKTAPTAPAAPKMWHPPVCRVPKTDFFTRLAPINDEKSFLALTFFSCWDVECTWTTSAGQKCPQGVPTTLHPAAVSNSQLISLIFDKSSILEKLEPHSMCYRGKVSRGAHVPLGWGQVQGTGPWAQRAARALQLHFHPSLVQKTHNF